MPSTTAGLFYALSDYLTQTRQLLRDNTGTLYSTADLTYFINTAMRQRDLDLACNRVRYSFTLTTNVFRYTFATITATGVVLDGSSTAILQDLRSVIIMPVGSSTSSVRVPLARWPYSKLAFLLSTSAPTYPMAYALYGANTVVLAPPPAGAYPAEFDFIGYGADLVATTDQDTMPYPFTDPVPYQAARLAKVQAQLFADADGFEALYQNRLNRVRAQSRSLAVAQPWSDLPTRKR